jgi:drug/metabolite transporter, DME family
MLLRTDPGAIRLHNVSGGTRSRLQILAAAVLFSTGGAAIKACSLTSWQVASFRSGVAALALLLLLPAARRNWSWRPALVGFAYAATVILFVHANKLTTAANTIFLQSTAPMYILLLGPWLLKEPVRKRDFGFVAALAVGMSLFFVGIEPPVRTAPAPLQGNLLAVASGVCWALTVVGLRWTGRVALGSPGAGSAASAVAIGNLIAFFVGLPMAIPESADAVADWVIIVYLGVFQIGLAYAFLSSAIRHVRALDVSLLLLAEPVLNPLWAWLAHGEQPGPWSMAGAALILTATTFKALKP